MGQAGTVRGGMNSWMKQAMNCERGMNYLRETLTSAFHLGAAAGGIVGGACR